MGPEMLGMERKGSGLRKEGKKIERKRMRKEVERKTLLHVSRDIMRGPRIIPSKGYTKRRSNSLFAKNPMPVMAVTKVGLCWETTTPTRRPLAQKLESMVSIPRMSNRGMYLERTLCSYHIRLAPSALTATPKENTTALIGQGKPTHRVNETTRIQVIPAQNL